MNEMMDVLITSVFVWYAWGVAVWTVFMLEDVFSLKDWSISFFAGLAWPITMPVCVMSVIRKRKW